MTELTSIHIYFLEGRILTLDYFKAILGKPFAEAGLSVMFEPNEKPELLYQLHSTCFFSIKIMPEYFTTFLSKGNDPLGCLLQTNLRVLDPLLKFQEPGRTPADYGFDKMAVFYEGIKPGQMYFRFPVFMEDADERKAWESMINIISKHEAGDEKQAEWLQTVMVQKDQMWYFQQSAENGEWMLMDTLDKITLALSQDYFVKKGDNRVRKPQIIVNEDHFNQHFIWDNQWELNHDGIRLILPRPNELALYISLSDKSAENAKAIYESEKIKQNEPFYHPLLRQNEAAIFYDYFEEVISAVIFSYTAIETMANSCIVNSYQYSTQNKGVTSIYSKEAIERKFSLRDKLKIILPDILKTADPTKEEWWQLFNDLEEIRNGLIHFKQQDSIDLYSRLLEKKVFTLIEVSKNILRFYGQYVKQNGKEVLNDFPYGYGSDNVRPYFMTHKDYWHELRTAKGIPDPEENEENQ